MKADTMHRREIVGSAMLRLKQDMDIQARTTKIKANSIQSTTADAEVERKKLKFETSENPQINTHKEKTEKLNEKKIWVNKREYMLYTEITPELCRIGPTEFVELSTIFTAV